MFILTIYLFRALSLSSEVLYYMITTCITQNHSLYNLIIFTFIIRIYL